MSFSLPYPLIMRPPGMLAVVLALVPSLAIAEIAPFGDSPSLLSGMSLRDAMFVLEPRKQDQRTLIRAEQARIEPATDLLQLVGMDLSARRGNGSFAMKAAKASCDLRRSAIRTEGTCLIRSKGLSIAGESFDGNASTLVFRTGLPIEVSSDPIRGAYLTKPTKHRGPSVSPWSFTVAPDTGSIRAREPSFPLRLVQDFSGNLTTFARCWRWVKSTAWPEMPHASGPVAMASPDGGIIDLAGHNLEFLGPSAILGPDAVLVTASGLRLYHDTGEDQNVLRATAAGGVTGWMKSATKEYSVHANNMDFAGDLPLLQFEGGPVLFRNGDIILQATEEWQFLRVMENGKIVISPGSWTTRSAHGG